MIECKAVPLTEKVLQQVTGLQSLCAGALPCDCECGYGQDGVARGRQYRFIDFIPRYDDLIASV